MWCPRGLELAQSRLTWLRWRRSRSRCGRGVVAVWSGVGRRCSAGGSRVGTGAGAAESRSFYTRIALCGSLVRLQMNVGLVGDVGVGVGEWRVQTSVYDVPRIAMLQRPARQLQGARNADHVIIAAEA